MNKTPEDPKPFSLAGNNGSENSSSFFPAGKGEISYPSHGRTRAFVSDGAAIPFSLGLAEAMLENIDPVKPAVFIHVWRAATRGVVLGSACRMDGEVCRDVNRHGLRVDIFRRISGGGTVLLGPNVFCYSFVFSRAVDPGSIHDVFASVHQVVIKALRRFGVKPRAEPVSDLAVESGEKGLLKLAGHAQKRTRKGILCEGSLLAAPFSFPVGEVLAPPPREPPYRRGRSHKEFMTSLKQLGFGISFEEFTGELLKEGGAKKSEPVPGDLKMFAEKLALEKYCDSNWTERF